MQTCELRVAHRALRRYSEHKYPGKQLAGFRPKSCSSCMVLFYLSERGSYHSYIQFTAANFHHETCAVEISGFFYGVYALSLNDHEIVCIKHIMKFTLVM